MTQDLVGDYIEAILTGRHWIQITIPIHVHPTGDLYGHREMACRLVIEHENPVPRNSERI